MASPRPRGARLPCTVSPGRGFWGRKSTRPSSAGLRPRRARAQVPGARAALPSPGRAHPHTPAPLQQPEEPCTPPSWRRGRTAPWPLVTHLPPQRHPRRHRQHPRGPGCSPPWGACPVTFRGSGLGTMAWLLCVRAFSKVSQEIARPRHRVLTYLSPDLCPVLSPQEVGAGPRVHW